MSRVLYRKYRPLTLADVVGQEQVTRPLQAALDQDKIGHAYLFVGPRGTGKTSVARILAHAVNHFPYTLEDHRIDIVEIDAASNTGVDNIRELREKAIIAPAEGKYKVYIIDEVHMLSKSANNALLKTLEEPPAHVIFIMATTEADKIPITISSRTQIFHFQLATPQAMAAHLAKIAQQEKINITHDALELLARRGGGSFRDSLSLLDQVTTLTDQKITVKLLEQALGLPRTDVIAQLLAAYASADTAALRAILAQLLDDGLAAETIAAELIAAIIAQPTAATLPLLSRLTGVAAPFPEAKLLVALLDGQLSSGNNFTPVNVSSATAAKPAPTPQTPTTPSAPAKPPVSAEPQPSAKPQPSAEPSTPAKSPSPKKPPVSAAPAAAPFAWDDFLAAVRAASPATAVQLEKCQFQHDGQTLHLYPSNKICAGILKRPQHGNILTAELHGGSLIVHEIGDQPRSSEAATQDSAADTQLSQALGDIQDFSGDVPF